MARVWPREVLQEGHWPLICTRAVFGAATDFLQVSLDGDTLCGKLPRVSSEGGLVGPFEPKDSGLQGTDDSETSG